MTPGARFVTRPKKGASFRIDVVNDPFREKDGAHCVDWEARKNGVDQDLTSTFIEKMPMPTSKIRVKAIKQRLQVSEADLCGGERESKVRLGEGGDRAPKRSFHSSSTGFWNIYRNERALIEVNV